MHVLHFTHRGKHFSADESGRIKRHDMPGFQRSDSWRLIGVSTHHWHRRIVHDLSDLFANPSLMVGGYVWDNDHCIVRTWGGSYGGRVPRVTSAWIEEE